MKVSLYKVRGFDLAVLLQATPGTALAPVVVSHVPLSDIREVVGLEVGRMKAAELQRRPRLGQE